MYLKYIQCAKTCKNVQKRASQVLTYQKTCISRSHLPKNVQKRAKNVQKRAKTCKNVQKRAKMCKNVHLKCFWTLFKNVHCQGPCSLRPCISRPYCTQKFSDPTRVHKVVMFETSLPLIHKLKEPLKNIMHHSLQSIWS